MTVVALTESQRDAVAGLVRAGRVEKLVGGADEHRARSFLVNASSAMSDLAMVKTAVVRHDLAYAVMHDVGEAMLAAYGFRTVRGDGKHEAVGRFLAAVFDSPPTREAARHVDDVRRNRNDRYYRAHEPSEQAVRLAGDHAQMLVDAAARRLL